jgi:hypothetical protein
LQTEVSWDSFVSSLSNELNPILVKNELPIDLLDALHLKYPKETIKTIESISTIKQASEGALQTFAKQGAAYEQESQNEMSRRKLQLQSKLKKNIV